MVFLLNPPLTEIFSVVPLLQRIIYCNRGFWEEGYHPHHSHKNGITPYNG